MNCVDSKQRIAVFLIVLAMLANACRAQVPIETGYGRTSGTGFGASINGTSVFANLFRERGRRVDTSKVISPKIENYETIVWFPDRFDAPRTEVIDRLNLWMQLGSNRTVIYVGRDYDATIDYWQNVVDTSKGLQSELAQRKLAESISEFEFRRQTVALDERCDWFQLKRGDEQVAKRLTGPWASSLKGSNISIQLGRVQLKPPAHWSTQGRQTEVLLGSADGELIYRIQSISTYDPHAIVVTNGSMLLNYRLVNSENRVIADLLVSESSGYGPVLFLESGPEDIRIANTDARQGTQWSWVGQPPLRYIVPHFLLLGVIYCFIWFPIFGRAKKLPPETNSNFGLHIESIAHSLANSGQENEAYRILNRYRETLKHEET